MSGSVRSASGFAEIRPKRTLSTPCLAPVSNLFDNGYQRLIAPLGAWHGACSQKDVLDLLGTEEGGFMRIYKNSQAGFTIIELMIVVMIIGVLAAIVLPNVRSYAVRAKMSEAMLALAPCKDAVSEAYQSQGGLPDAGSWGCEGTNVSQYVAAVDTTMFGTVRVTLRGFNDGRLDSHEITLAPLDSSGNLPTGPDFIVRRWRCGSPADGTDILPQYIPLYLPAGCRG